MYTCHFKNGFTMKWSNLFYPHKLAATKEHVLVVYSAKNKKNNIYWSIYTLLFQKYAIKHEFEHFDISNFSQSENIHKKNSAIKLLLKFI